VGDLDSVLGFYRDAVGLRVHERTPERAVLGAAEACLELRATEDPPRGGDEAGLHHTAFRVPDRAALGDALERLPDLDGASDHLVSEALYAQDPEGNGVEVYRDKPRDEWPDAPDSEVRMDTLPLDLDALRADAGGSERASDGTDVGHVHLEVLSLSETRAFYADALGLAVTQELRGALFLAGREGDGEVYHHHVGANVWHGRSEPPTGRGVDAFELRAPADAIEEATERLRAEGYAVEDGRVTDPSGIDLVLCGE
jgi:catechol 2,3-dioxygenase